MLDAINGLSDVGFVLFVVAVLLSLYALMTATHYVFKGPGFSFFPATTSPSE